MAHDLQTELKGGYLREPSTRHALRAGTIVRALVGVVIGALLARSIIYGAPLLWTWLDENPVTAAPGDQLVSAAVPYTGSKVPMEVYIMSKCPDARDCLRDLVVPAMANISSLVDFKLEFIGQVDGGELKCKHGPEECYGNIIELCAAELYPDPKISLGFTNCLTKDYAEIPGESLVERCAAEYAVDADRLHQCVEQDEGEHGSELLQQSFARTKRANVTLSCTIRLDHELRCIRDGGRWKSCEGGSDPDDLIRDVRKAANALASTN